MTRLSLAFASLAIVLATDVRALEAFKTFDDFGTQPISAARWTDAERVRVIKGGALQLMQRSYGVNFDDLGLTFVNWNDNLLNPGAITAIGAKVRVNELEVNHCSTNPAVAQSRARLIGSFFNAAASLGQAPVAGSMVYDVIAQIRLARFSNSADAPGVLRVQGIASLCTTADCAGASTIGNVVDLGTATVGQAINVQMQWDQGGKSFLFSRDNGAFSGSAAYAFDDTVGPTVAFKQVSTRVDLPACTAGRVAGMVDATFDNVSVNASAAP